MTFLKNVQSKSRNLTNILNTTLYKKPYKEIFATKHDGLWKQTTTNELIALAKSVSRSPSRRELDLLVSVGERVSMTLLSMAINDLGIEARSFTGSQSGIITNENHVARVVGSKLADEWHRCFASKQPGTSRGQSTRLTKRYR